MPPKPGTPSPVKGQKRPQVAAKLALREARKAEVIGEEKRLRQFDKETATLTQKKMFVCALVKLGIKPGRAMEEAGYTKSHGAARFRNWLQNDSEVRQAMEGDLRAEALMGFGNGVTRLSNYLRSDKAVKSPAVTRRVTAELGKIAGMYPQAGVGGINGQNVQVNILQGASTKDLVRLANELAGKIGGADRRGEAPAGLGGSRAAPAPEPDRVLRTEPGSGEVPRVEEAPSVDGRRKQKR